MNLGFFNMDIITQVCNQKDLSEAKNIAYAAIDALQGATPDNKLKARRVVDKASSVKSLGITLTNFMFAHPSENLKVIKK